MYTGGMGGLSSKKFDPTSQTNYDNKEVKVIKNQTHYNNLVLVIKRKVRYIYL